jgi:hypothetical protein
MNLTSAHTGGATAMRFKKNSSEKGIGVDRWLISAGWGGVNEKGTQLIYRGPQPERSTGQCPEKEQ